MFGILAEVRLSTRGRYRRVLAAANGLGGMGLALDIESIVFWIRAEVGQGLVGRRLRGLKQSAGQGRQGQPVKLVPAKPPTQSTQRGRGARR
jgi:hypothetical protein